MCLIQWWIKIIVLAPRFYVVITASCESSFAFGDFMVLDLAWFYWGWCFSMELERSSLSCFFLFTVLAVIFSGVLFFVFSMFVVFVCL